MRNNGNRIKWIKEDSLKSFAVYTNGRKAYNLLLDQNFPLPQVNNNRLTCWSAKKKVSQAQRQTSRVYAKPPETSKAL